jgi:hypothetical protein
MLNLYFGLVLELGKGSEVHRLHTIYQRFWEA